MSKSKRSWEVTLSVSNELSFAYWFFLASMVISSALQGDWVHAAASTTLLIIGTVATWDIMRPTLFAWMLGERSTILKRGELDEREG